MPHNLSFLRNIVLTYSRDLAMIDYGDIRVFK
nr:MAG TPA: hypothetical protein [Caudoviricetes sp.]